MLAFKGLENILRHAPPGHDGSYLSFMEDAGVPAALQELMRDQTTNETVWTEAEAFMHAHFPHYSDFAGATDDEDDAEGAGDGKDDADDGALPPPPAGMPLP